MQVLRLNSCLRLSIASRYARPAPFPTTRYSTSTEEKDDFKPVYRLPLIIAARAICRLKLYQTAIVAGLTGFSIISQANLTLPIILSTVSLAMLAVMGEFFRRLIGLIYVNPETNKVKIAHLTFWGNRREVIHNITDIVPISDTRDRYSDIFVKVNFYDKSTRPFYLSIRYGLIYDKELFKRVIGEDVESIN